MWDSLNNGKLERECGDEKGVGAAFDMVVNGDIFGFGREP